MKTKIVLFVLVNLTISATLCAMQINNNNLDLAWATGYFDDDTDYALASAAGAGRLELVKALLNDPRKTEADVNYALEIAALTANFNVFAIIIQDKRINIPGIMNALRAAQNTNNLVNV